MAMEPPLYSFKKLVFSWRRERHSVRIYLWTARLLSSREGGTIWAATETLSLKNVSSHIKALIRICRTTEKRYDHRVLLSFNTDFLNSYFNHWHYLTFPRYIIVKSSICNDSDNMESQYLCFICIASFYGIGEFQRVVHWHTFTHPTAYLFRIQPHCPSWGISKAPNCLV